MAESQLAVSLVLNADDLMSPKVTRALRGIQQLQRGVEALNQAAPQAGAAGAAAQAGQQMQAAQQQAGSLGNAVQGLLQNLGGAGGALGLTGRLIAGASAATAVAAGLGLAANRSRQMRVDFERTSNTLAGFATSGDAVNQMLQDASANARLTGQSLSDVYAAQSSLASVARTPAQMRQMVELAERLAFLAPEQGIQGAAFAIREAQANQFESAVDRMNLNRAAINRLLAQGVSGTDVLTRALDEMGVTMEDVANQSQGLEGQTARLNNTLGALLATATAPAWSAWEARMKDINDITGGGTQGQTALGRAMAGGAGLVGQGLGYGAQGIGLGIQIWLQSWDIFFRMQEDTYNQLDRFFKQTQYRAIRNGVALGWVTPGMGEASSIAAATASLDTQASIRDLGRTQASADITRTITGTLPSDALDRYLSNLDRLNHLDDGLREHARSWNSVTTRILDATNQVDFFQRQLEQLQAASGFAGGLRGELQRARALERRMGTYGGEYDAAIRDLYRREHGYTLDEGEAALQAYLAARERESRGGEFAADRVRVDTQHVDAQTVIVNGATAGGGAQPSGISGSGLPAGGPPRGRYAQAQSAWPWWIPGQAAPGIGRALG